MVFWGGGEVEYEARADAGRRAAQDSGDPTVRHRDDARRTR